MSKTAVALLILAGPTLMFLWIVFHITTQEWFWRRHMRGWRGLERSMDRHVHLVYWAAQVSFRRPPWCPYPTKCGRGYPTPTAEGWGKPVCPDCMKKVIP